MADSNRQKYLQNFQKPDSYSRKTENGQILFKGQKFIQTLFTKIVQSAWICSRLFEELKKKTKSNDQK